jgi:hypothetical protein
LAANHAAEADSAYVGVARVRHGSKEGLDLMYVC